MINFQKLLDWRFWFSLRPSALSDRTAKFILFIFCIILVISLIFKILMRLKKKNPPLVKLYSKLYKLFLTMGLLGFILLFLSYEQIYLLGSRFWYLIWFIGFLIWLGLIIYHLIVKLPKEKKKFEEKKQFEKYLPR